MSVADAAAPTRRRSSLTVSSGLLGLGALVTRFATLVVMAMLARDAGIESVGYYGLATLSASLTAAAVSVGLPTYLTRDTATGLVRRPEVARIHLGRLPVLGVAVAVAYPVLGAALSATVHVAFVLFFVGSLLEQWNETAWVLVRGRRTAWVEPAVNSSAGVLLITVCAVDVWLLDGLTLRDAGVYFVVTAFLRSAAATVMTELWTHLRTPAQVRVVHHVRSALPYFASDLLGLLYFRGDVLVLALFVGAADVGAYVAAAGIVGPAVQVAASMGVGALAYAAPRGGGSASQADDAALIFRYFRTAGHAAAGLLLVGLPVVVAILFGDAGQSTLVLAMILAMFLVLRFANFGLSAVLLAGGRASRRLIVLVLSILGNVALNLLLDSRFGAEGAATATVLTELIVAGSLLYFIGRRELLRPVVVSCAFLAVVATVMAGLLAVAAPAVVAPATGVLLLMAAAAGLVVQQRSVRPTKASESV